ncbi:MAG: type II toxin-antitoxin system YafQ family toxin [Lachnospiraceae bacterium]|nr:type II toxin-antitoxin system YafQ family toxin [Lachnospiraceae bacterium]
MLRPEFTGQFKKDYKLAIKRGCNPDKLQELLLLKLIRTGSHSDLF